LLADRPWRIGQVGGTLIVLPAPRTLIAARDWLTVVRLPAYAPDINPTEGV
jgi:hypothetical protein